MFVIMITAGSFILSDLVELTFNYKAIQPAMRKQLNRSDPRATKREKIELLTAVLAGKLPIEDAPVNPQKELNAIVTRDADLRKTVKTSAFDAGVLDAVWLMPFGSAVGAVILL